jgi:3-oxoadipate enol-lactonase
MPWADLTDATTYYELTGQGEAVLMIPGLGCTGEVWRPLVADLSRHFLLIRVDNRGLGRSESKRPARTISHFIADLAELLDHLQLERVHVIGMSLGGVIAQQFAIEHPDRVERLVLLSSAHRFTPYLSEMVRFMWVSVTRLPRKRYLRSFELLTSGPGYLDAAPERFERLVAQACERRVSRLAVMRQLKALRASRFVPADYRIDCPTLVMSGECDHLIPAYYARQMANEIRDCELVVVPGAGHSLLNECPAEVLRRVMAFLRNAKADKGKKRMRDVIFMEPAGLPRMEAAVVERAGTLS